MRSVKRSVFAGPLYRRTSAVFAVSRQIEARCREVGLPDERVHWIPGAADLPRFGEAVDGEAIREEFKLGRAPVVVSVARFAANRGHEQLLTGFSQLLRRLPDARLLLVGKGERRGDRLGALVADEESRLAVHHRLRQGADGPRDDRPAGREELAALGRDGALRRQVRIIGLEDDQKDKQDREEQRRAERDAKRKAEAERLARLGY